MKENESFKQQQTKDADLLEAANNRIKDLEEQLDR